MWKKMLPRLDRIYEALADESSRRIYKHRLLYSLFGEEEAITDLIHEVSPASRGFKTSKICFYGAGEGAGWLLKTYGDRVPFVMDTYKTGSIQQRPIITLEEFLQMPDCRDYLIVITVAKEAAQREIQMQMEAHGLHYLLAYFGVQYFDLPQLQMKNEYFVDAGAFNGDTSSYFFQHVKGGHAYVFEPNPEQLASARTRLKAYPHAEFFPYGLYDENQVIRFASCSSDAGSAQISPNGDLEIEVRKLDDVLQDRKVTFIKMDIEGSELAALRGAEQIIRRQKPKLAICVYHKPEDMWEIPELLLEYCPQYRFYLRHYSITHTETVLYAIPESGRKGAS